MKKNAPNIQDDIDCVIQLARDEVENLRKDAEEDEDSARDYEDSKRAVERVEKYLAEKVVG